MAGILAIAISVHARRVTGAARTDAGLPAPRPRPTPRAFTPQDRPTKPHPSGWHRHFGLPSWLPDALAQLGLVILVLLVVFLLVRWAPGRKPRRRPARPDLPVNYAATSPAQLADRVSATFDAALAQFRGGDREAAIIACWLRLERIAESAGFPARSTETSSELASRWSNVLPLNRQPLFQLNELYREARFSSHRMSAEDFEIAKRALDILRRDVASQLSRIADG